MTRSVIRLCLIAALCVAWLAGLEPARAERIAGTESSAPVAGQALHGAALLAALRSGGLVVYFRHTATDFSKTDGTITDYRDCAQQRLLSAKGRSDAEILGRRLRALKLPMGTALASPYCRTMEHARLSFGMVSPRNEIRESTASGDYAGLRQLLAEPVASGTLRWVVGHGTPFRSIAGPPHLAEGEAAVIAPGRTHWTVVARLTLEDWAALERAATPN
jgi:phosphohistidine phosphatase SixA